MAIIGIPLGWIMNWLQQLIGNYGWTLVVFTVIVKILMTPLTIKQQKSSAKMAAFQPKMKELENRYKNNKAKYQEEMMKLYEREGYSPTSGCLPTLIQMIILFGIIEVVYRPLRYVLQISNDTISAACEALKFTSSQQLQLINIVQSGTGEQFNTLKNIFSADDLAKIAEFDMNFLGLDLTQIPTLGFNWLVLIPILSGATAFLMSVVSMKQQNMSAQQQGGMMKAMMYASPIMSLVFAFQLPAGVGLYWIISNVVSFVAGEITRRIYTPEKLAEMAAKDKGTERQREKYRKKREMIEKLTQERANYAEASGKTKEELENARDIVAGKQGKPSTSTTSQTRKKPESESDELSANDRIAAARRRLAELYGDDNETDTANTDKK